MPFPSPSVGDVIMLSQLAWKIGCAFTAGRAGAPAEFQEVENELKSLTTAVTLLAESLDTDDPEGGILAQADQRTQEGLDKIIGCCRQTLESLEAFVDQYQEIRRSDESTGLASQRRWKSILLKNWKKIMWTTEGGGLQSLRSMLAIHVSSIVLAMQALQSRSLLRLEQIIEPVANQMNNIHDKLNGNLDVKIDEMHHLMLSLRAGIESSPMMWPQRAQSLASQPISPVFKTKDERRESYPLQEEGPEQAVPEKFAYHYSPQKTPELSDSELSAYSSRSLDRFGEGYQIDQRESLIIPLEHQFRLKDAPPLYKRSRQPSSSSAGSMHLPDATPLSPYSTYRRRSDRSSDLLPRSPTMLPLPALNLESEVPNGPQKDYNNPNSIGGQECNSNSLSKASATVSQQDFFKRQLFTNAAVLCEVRGKSIEYTQPDEEQPGEWRMVDACPSCSVYLVRKQYDLTSGAIRYSTSIWALSDDWSVRLEQRLADGEVVIPYTVWGNDAKAVLRVRAELKFHDITLDANPVYRARTSWVNYCFEHERAATLFQNALIGSTLLLTVKTKATMRLHDGISGAFAFAEQLCGLENLRIFQDPSSGACLALLHYSPHFREGYMVFPLNSLRKPLTIKDDGENTIKIRGLDIPLDNSRMLQRRDSATPTSKPKNTKYIAGAKIEFSTAMDKLLFKEKFREIQEELFSMREQ